MRALKTSNAVKVVKAGDVPGDVRDAIRKTSKRANYYQLNFEWAETVLEGVDEKDDDIDHLETVGER